MSRAPLVLLTADRPPELRGVGANQTIEQPSSSARYVLRSSTLRSRATRPTRRPGTSSSSRPRACRSAFAPLSGPVHVNLPFREPLVAGPVPSRSRSPTGPITSSPAGRKPSTTLEPCSGGGARGLIVAGSLRARRRTRPRAGPPAPDGRCSPSPHPGSATGSLAAGQLLISNERLLRRHMPERRAAVRRGSDLTSGLELVRRAPTARDRGSGPSRRGSAPEGRAHRHGRVRGSSSRRGDRDPVSSAATVAWLRSWLDADGRARAAVDASLDGLDEPFEGRVARDLAGSLPDGSTLVVGSSMPVRDLDAYMAPREGLRVLANRGASGIDGFVSTALGVAASGASTTALCGDLTLAARRRLAPVELSPRTSTPSSSCRTTTAARSSRSFRSAISPSSRSCSPRRTASISRRSARPPGPATRGSSGRATSSPRSSARRTIGGVHVVEVPTDRARNVELHAEVHAVVDAALRSKG